MHERPSPPPATGQTRARDILAAIHTLQAVEREHRPATDDEKRTLRQFGGFGPVANDIFPKPNLSATDPRRPFDGYSSTSWKAIGDELKSLLTPVEYASARGTVFSQFFTSPIVMKAMHGALARLRVAADATVLEPGAGIGNFIAHAPAGQRFIGVEKDFLTGRIARALHPSADLRIESFQDSKLPPLDAVIGNVPFADVDIKYGKRWLPLHDFFIAKSVDALKPGGVLAVVTSRFTLDKQNAAIREKLAEEADFLGAIRLPSDAFKSEGTPVVTDILFLRKRAPGQEPNHADADWLHVAPHWIEGAAVPVNRYFLKHPEMVLGDWSREDTMWGSEGFSIISNGDLASQLKEAVARLPVGPVVKSEPEQANPPPSQTKSTGLEIPAQKHVSSFAPHAPHLVSERHTAESRAALAAFQPPPLRHVTEGSFFVGDDKIIRQIENGNSEPVTYCGVLLRTDGTPQGRKIGSLIGLRDIARRVLQSQNEGWPESDREQARRNLNVAYDRFVSQYGPINKTTFTETKTGTIRRMPNLVKFREDPDAMLVMSLEEYDESTGKAEKAAIMKKDVVGPKPPVTHVSSAEEGLLVSLDHRGAVDLAYISQLFGKPEEFIIAELGDLIYRDPESKEWQTADAYLSGNVRAKLAAAERYGISHNAEALKAVQPEDVLPGDIDANLGAPWIPASDIQAFAAELFGVPPDSFKVSHLKKDAVWSVEPDYKAIQSVAATADYGTSRINGTELLSLGLNLKTPAIYDIVRGANGDERVLNPEETAAAREKQKHIKEKFKSWIFSNPDRTERLVRVYNDTYNNLRPRLFDGSHLDFPGMSTTITLKPHQVDAVWRCMTAGNTLLAHCVGAGKTYEMCAAGMKMKQAGIIKKPMYCIPNHMLEQFSREFMQLYPNAKLLIASKEDFTKERRKLLTAKIATGDWDGIIVTHSSFERIGMSKEFQERFLREQIQEYEELLIGKAAYGRNIIKSLEKQKARREERLKSLLAEDKKDDGLVFDELGIDQVFIDEFQAYKNLEAPTKMERVAGIPSGGSERAFDLYMKSHYLDELHPGHGLVGASGTPVSNSMVEVYTLQRYFDPKSMAERGIDHLDGWIATFAEPVESMEISPDGATLKPRTRLSQFVNIPELSQMFREFSDVQTAEMLNLPRPKLKGDKPQIIACPMSEDQIGIQQELVKRYERIRNEKVDPRVDNALKITTDGRKLALDGRMLGTGLDYPGSKINAVVAETVRTWHETAATRGTQMIFCDMGVHPKPFSVYDEIVAKLIDHGIPRHQIAVMGDADSDAKKQALFEKVRQGIVRVLIGSTQKMGTGTNVQKRLKRKHDLDVPWKPSEIEQRDGRILRQGNDNEEVEITRYVTEGSFDAFMWQANETKARFINQFMAGDCTIRRAEDISSQELSFAEVKAIASGNPAVLTLALTDGELHRLGILRKNHGDEQYLASQNVKRLPDDIKWNENRIAGLAEDMATIDGHPVSLPSMEALGDRLEALPSRTMETKRYKLGTYRGLEYGLIVHPLGTPDVYVAGAATRKESMARERFGARALINAVERLVDGYARDRGRMEAERDVKQSQFRDYQARIGKPFEHEEYVSQLTDLRNRLRLSLSDKPPEGCETSSDLAEKINTLRAANEVEAAPQRTGNRKAARAERPVTTRIRERMGRPAEIGPVVETAPSLTPAPAPVAEVIAMPEPVKPVLDCRQSVTRRRQGNEAQLRLF